MRFCVVEGVKAVREEAGGLYKKVWWRMCFICVGCTMCAGSTAVVLYARV